MAHVGQGSGSRHGEASLARVVRLGLANTTQRGPALRAVVRLLCVALVLGLGGCAPFWGAEPTPTTAATATPTSDGNAIGAPTATPTMAPTATPHTDASQPFTLTIWAPPDVAATADEAEGLLAQARQRVAASWPKASIEVLPKAADGPGGIASLLAAMQPVLPAHLPDAVLVDAAEIRGLVERGLAVPLDGLVSESLWEDLYPYAQQAVTVDGVRYGLPQDADLTAMYYNSAMVAEPPSDWASLLETSGGYLFPAAAGDDTAYRLFLGHYATLGGAWRSEDGQPMLDATVAARVLRGYRELVEVGAIPEGGLSLDSADACWAVYLTGESAVSSARSYQYLRDRGRVRLTRYAPQASFGGPAPAVANVRAWVILTRDATRQEVVGQFISQSLLPARAATWLAGSHYLPTARSPLPLLIEDENELAFWEGQLASAVPAPSADVRERIQGLVEQALMDVLDGSVSPEQAAVTASLAVESAR